MSCDLCSTCICNMEKFKSLTHSCALAYNFLVCVMKSAPFGTQCIAWMATWSKYCQHVRRKVGKFCLLVGGKRALSHTSVPLTHPSRNVEIICRLYFTLVSNTLNYYSYRCLRWISHKLIGVQIFYVGWMRGTLVSWQFMLVLWVEPRICRNNQRLTIQCGFEPAALPFLRILLVHDGVYYLPCSGWALGVEPYKRNL